MESSVGVEGWGVQRGYCSVQRLRPCKPALYTQPHSAAGLARALTKDAHQRWNGARGQSRTFVGLQCANASQECDASVCHTCAATHV